MQRYFTWDGFPPRNTLSFPTVSLGGHDMTAISMAYDLPNERFVIAADGRCALKGIGGEIETKTDEQQKIFPVESEFMSMVYAMTGFAGFGNGLFETIVEGGEVIRSLYKYRFHDGYEFAKKFSENMANAVQVARKTGRFPVIPPSEGLAAGEQGRLFKFYLLGYYGGFPFFAESRFYHIEETDHIQVRGSNPELCQSQTLFTGSDLIAAMIYGNALTDPRIAKHKPAKSADALEVATGFINACSDPAAVEIDPWCRIVGGRLHAAEISLSGFRWLISPAA